MEISAVAIPGGEGIKAAEIGPCRLVDLAGLRERGQLLKPLDCCNGRRVVNPGHGQHRGVDVKARKRLKHGLDQKQVRVPAACGKRAVRRPADRDRRGGQDGRALDGIDRDEFVPRRVVRFTGDGQSVLPLEFPDGLHGVWAINTVRYNLQQRLIRVCDVSFFCPDDGTGRDIDTGA